MAALRAIGTGVLWGVYALPWVWLALFAAAVAMAIAQFGHFPSYGDPDPKRVEGIYAVYWAIFLLFFPLFFSPLVAGGQAIVGLVRKTRVRPLPLLGYALGYALFAAILFGDAFGLRDWYMD